MKKTISIILLAILIVNIFAFCSCSKNEVPKGMQIAYRSDSLYKLYVPSSWRVDISSNMVSAYDSKSNPLSVSVSVIDNPNEYTLKEYWHNYLDDFKLTYKDFALINEANTTLDNKEAIEYVFSGKLSYSDNSREYEYTIDQYLVSNFSKIFIISFSVFSSQYEDNKETIDDIIKNFKFNDNIVEINNNPEAKEAPEGMKYASNDIVDYDFYIPESWIQDMNTGAISAYATTGEDKTSVNVTAWDVSYMVNVIEDWRESFILDMSMISNNFADNVVVETTLDGFSAYRYESTATISGEDMKYIQIAAARKYMIYLITYTATPEYYDTHLSELEEMINNFKFN